MGPHFVKQLCAFGRYVGPQTDEASSQTRRAYPLLSEKARKLLLVDLVWLGRRDQSRVCQHDYDQIFVVDAVTWDGGRKRAKRPKSDLFSRILVGSRLIMAKSFCL